MDRQRFLDAQLWMRKSAAAWPVNADGGTNGSDSQHALLLPASAAATVATAWCCFHVGSRICFFPSSVGADDDPTQQQLELMLVQKKATGSSDGELLARFDKKHVYTVDLRQLVNITPPQAVASTEPSVQSNMTQSDALPPFGCLEFPNVSLRIWMDPQQVPHGTARQLLHDAMLCVQQCVQQCVVNKRKAMKLSASKSSTHKESAWRAIFRHSKWLRSTKCDATSSVHNGSSHDGDDNGAALQLTPAEFLTRARKILKSDADFDAVKVTFKSIVSASRRHRRSSPSSKRRKRAREEENEDGQGNGDASGDDDDRRDDERLSNMELILLLVELTHILGDDHEGVQELLGFPSSKRCTSHDRCVVLSDDGERSSCVTSKWQAWDDYVEMSRQVLDPTRRSNDRLSALDSTSMKQIQASADSFERAIVDDDATAAWQRRIQLQRDQIHSYERMGFNTFFPDDRKRLHPLQLQGTADTSSTIDNAHPSRAITKRPTTQPDGTAAYKLQRQQMQVEQTFAVLLDKRKQLVRDELLVALLPQRTVHTATK
ncbi:hypothetical protein FI667_g708, partial [Globisporangium splendens]